MSVWYTHVNIISSVWHGHTIPGWSYHIGVPLLIYEYMTNGSLDQHVFHQQQQPQQEEDRSSIQQWHTRYNILRDIYSHRPVLCSPWAWTNGAAPWHQGQQHYARCQLGCSSQRLRYCLHGGWGQELRHRSRRHLGLHSAGICNEPKGHTPDWHLCIWGGHPRGGYRQEEQGCPVWRWPHLHLGLAALWGGEVARGRGQASAGLSDPIFEINCAYHISPWISSWYARINRNGTESLTSHTFHNTESYIRFLHNGSQAVNFITRRKHYAVTQNHRQNFGCRRNPIYASSSMSNSSSASSAEKHDDGWG